MLNIVNAALYYDSPKAKAFGPVTVAPAYSDGKMYWPGAYWINLGLFVVAKGMRGWGLFVDKKDAVEFGLSV
jgi:hypothetical protein